MLFALRPVASVGASVVGLTPVLLKVLSRPLDLPDQQLEPGLTAASHGAPRNPEELGGTVLVSTTTRQEQP